MIGIHSHIIFGVDDDQAQKLFVVNPKLIISNKNTKKTIIV